MARTESREKKMKAWVLVASNDSTLKDNMRQFFSNRKNRVYFENISCRTIFRLIEAPIDILMIDVEDCIVKSGTDFCSDILDVIRRLRPDIQIISFVDDASVETYRHLSKKGILYRATKPVQLPEIAIIMKSLETVNKKRFSEHITFKSASQSQLTKSARIIDGIKWTQGLSIGLIFSRSKTFRRRIAKLFNSLHLSYIFEQLKTNTLMRILELNPRVILIEDDEKDTDRFDFIRLIRRLRPRVPVIVITRSRLKKDHKEYIKSGVTRCIVMPVQTKEIDSLISDFANHSMMINVS